MSDSISIKMPVVRFGQLYNNKLLKRCRKRGVQIADYALQIVHHSRASDKFMIFLFSKYVL